MENKRLIRILVIGALMVGVVFVSGCVEEKPSREDRAFVEAQLLITDSIASNAYTREFGVQVGQQYHLQLTAEKFMYKVDGEMDLKINLPEGIQVISGNLEWKGRDKRKSIEVVIKSDKEGDYLINATAINLDLIDPAINNLPLISKIKICVRDTVIEAMKACEPPKSEQNSSLRKIKDVNLGSENTSK